MGMLKEFEKFAMRGNVIDMAVGIVIGAAFGGIVSSLVADVIMPPIGMLMQGVDFSNLGVTLQEAGKDAAGKDVPAVVLGYGKFINTVINFVIVAFAIFLVVKAMNSAKKRFEKEQQAAAPAAPPADVALLTEIRDLLKAKA